MLKLKKILLPCAALCSAILFMGVEDCEYLDEEKDEIFGKEFLETETEPQKAVISIHSIVRYPRAEELERTIPGYFGEDICINKNPLLFSKEITKIEAVPRKNDTQRYNLRLHLTDRGRKMWIGLSVPNHGVNLAFVIDGMYYRSFQPRTIYDDVTNIVIIDGPFDQATALEIQNNSEKNYKKSHHKW